MRAALRSLTLLCLAWAGLAAHTGAPQEEAPRALAVVVNPKNPVTNLTSRELRSYMKLEQQFWPSREKVTVFLRPNRTQEMQVLLEKVYKMSSAELGKYWIGKVHRGEIHAKPSVIPTAKSVGTRIPKIEGAITVVLSHEVPKGLRVLTIDGKKPGEKGYPLLVPADTTLGATLGAGR